jgi:hypothetical protein
MALMRAHAGKSTEPKEFQRRLPRELESVILKAIEKTRTGDSRQPLNSAPPSLDSVWLNAAKPLSVAPATKTPPMEAPAKSAGHVSGAALGLMFRYHGVAAGTGSRYVSVAQIVRGYNFAANAAYRSRSGNRP